MPATTKVLQFTRIGILLLIQSWRDQRIRGFSSEKEIIAALLRRDDQAAELFVRQNGPWMFNVARRILNNEAAAADCVQEAFLSAFTNIEKFESRSTLKTWLHRIVVNKCLMWLRAHKRKAEEPIDEWMPKFDSNNCRIENPWTQLLSADEIAEKQELRTIVHKAIQKLPEHFRLVLQLRDIEEFNTAEVAEKLGISESNVKVRLHRGRSALKLMLEPVLRGDIS